jgi:hypothetical protein
MYSAFSIGFASARSAHHTQSASAPHAVKFKGKMNYLVHPTAEQTAMKALTTASTATYYHIPVWISSVTAFSPIQRKTSFRGLGYHVYSYTRRCLKYNDAHHRLRLNPYPPHSSGRILNYHPTPPTRQHGSRHGTSSVLPL